MHLDIVLIFEFALYNPINGRESIGQIIPSEMEHESMRQNVRHIRRVHIFLERLSFVLIELFNR